MGEEQQEMFDNICETLGLDKENWSQCHLKVADLAEQLKEARELLLRSRTGLSNMIKQEVFIFCNYEDQTKREIHQIDEYLSSRTIKKHY